MRDYPTPLSLGLVLDTAIDDYILATGRHIFPVVQAGRLVGFLTLEEIKAVPRVRWSMARVMTPRERVMTVGPDHELAEAFDALSGEGAEVLPVVEANSLVGVLSRHRAVAFLRAQTEFGA